MKQLYGIQQFKFNYWKKLTGQTPFTLFFIEAYKIKKQTNKKKIIIQNTHINLMDINYLKWTNFFFYTNANHINKFNYNTVSPTQLIKKNQLMINLEIIFFNNISKIQYVPKMSSYIVQQKAYLIHYLQIIQIIKKYNKHILLCLLIKYKYNFFKVLKIRKNS